MNRFDLAAARRALPPRPRDFHKKKAEVLVVAGSRDYLGAALLCSRGALRCGAGMVRLALPAALVPYAQAALPEAVVAGLSVDEAPGAAQGALLLEFAATAGAAVVGPGLGRRPETLALVRELWTSLPRPSVFDADALSALAPGPRPPAGRVLTPHEGELKLLMGPRALAQGREAAAAALASAYGCVALLKGPATLVAGPDGALTENTEGGPVLATAGSGDVLSGAVAALMAQGAAPRDAAGLGAWIHGRAAGLWAGRHAGRGLLASDLADALPDALAALEG